MTKQHTLTPKELLKKVNKLFSSKEKWTQDDYARDDQGIKIHNPLSEEASCFCLMGGIRKCAFDLGYENDAREENGIVEDTYNIVQGYTHYPIPDWNDNPNRKFEDIKYLLKELTV